MHNCPANVYFPTEDSYLLADNVKIAKDSSVADIGCGSGIQSINALQQGARRVYSIDINSNALQCTKENCEKAGFSGKIFAIKSDLFAKFTEKVDCIIFNPPYVESGNFRFTDLDGGKKGREVLDRFLAQMPKHLNENGRCFFLQTGLNGYAKTEQKLRKLGLSFEVVVCKKFFFEELCIYRCWKAPQERK